MIFLLRLSDLNEWHQLHSRRKEYLRCSIDSPQVHHCLRIFTFDFLEHVPQRIKTIINIVIAGIALCKIKRKRWLENCGRKIVCEILIVKVAVLCMYESIVGKPI